MLKNFLKTALRNMNRQKIYSLINILGLAIGMTMALLIFIWIADETGYDRFHADSDRIYRVSQVHCIEGRISKFANTPGVLAETLMLECPEVELATRVRSEESRIIIQKDHRRYHEKRIGITDEKFFSIFSFPIIKGSPEDALATPGTVFISQKASEKYFGDSDPVGQMMEMFDQAFTVTGVFKDMPPHSHFHFDFLCSFDSFEEWKAPDWSWSPFKTYILVHKNGNVESLQKLLNTIAGTRMFGDGYAAWAAKGNYKELPLQKLTDIHLRSNLRWEFEANGNSMHVRFFTLISLFILAIAVINYMNLSTARSAGRAREVGIRKTIGSTRTSIISQFLMESVLTILLALVIMLLLTHIILPFFRQLVGKQWLMLPYTTVPFFIPLLIIVTVLIGLLSGLYPSLFLSAFEPTAVMSGSVSRGLKGSGLRSALVVFQFALSVSLLVGALVVKKQMDYVRNRDLGFEREEVVVLETHGEVGRKWPVLREEFMNHSAIVSVTASSSLPGKAMTHVGFHVVGSNDHWPGTNCFAVDYDFLDTMKIKMSDGRYFSNNILSDKRAVIINMSKAREIGLDGILKKQIVIGGRGEEPFKVIGVIEDFHYQSLHVPVHPLGLVLLDGSSESLESYISIRVRSSNYHETIREIRKAWDSIVPGVPFSSSFLDSITNDQYKNEERTGHVFSIFTLFAIFVACIGLMGLASYAAEKRTKEIGIRKILGASAGRLVLMLSSEFTRWVVLANVIAWPLAYYAMRLWLNNFAYRTEMGVMPFIVSALIMFGISALTVGYHGLRAARISPAESLKYE